jgi:hypothetical protein
LEDAVFYFFINYKFFIFEYTNHRNTHSMEKVTLTKMYEVLAQKIGRSEAECLTHYVEVKIKDELITKTEILATKVLVKDECHALKEDIHALRNEMKDNTISLQKWMLGTFITLVIMILGLYATILLKH